MKIFLFLLTHPRHRFDNSWSSDGSHRESLIFQNAEIVKDIDITSDTTVEIENSNGQHGDQFATAWETLCWNQIQFQSCVVRIVNAEKCFIGSIKNEGQDEEKKVQDGILIHRSFDVEVVINLPDALFSRLTTLNWKDQGIRLSITHGTFMGDREEFKIKLDGLLFIKGNTYDIITYPLVQNTPEDSE